MTPIAFPVFLNLAGRACLVIGSGVEAKRKAALLRRAGAAVRASDAFQEALLDDAALVIVAGAPRDIAEAASRAAEARGILVNVVDEPELSSFIMPAIVDRAPVVVAISTSGTAPALAKLLRERLERALPQRLGALAALARRFRPMVARRLGDLESRRRFWTSVFTGRVAALALDGKPAAGALMAALDEAVGDVISPEGRRSA